MLGDEALPHSPAVCSAHPEGSDHVAHSRPPPRPMGRHCKAVPSKSLVHPTHASLQHWLFTYSSCFPSFAISSKRTDFCPFSVVSPVPAKGTDYPGRS